MVFAGLEICGIPGITGCLKSSQKVIYQPKPGGRRQWGRVWPENAAGRCGVFGVGSPVGERYLILTVTNVLLCSQVIDGHYPHVELHSSSLSFWQKGLSSDMGKSWMGNAQPPPDDWIPMDSNAWCRLDNKGLMTAPANSGRRTGNATEAGWEGLSQSVGSARSVSHSPTASSQTPNLAQATTLFARGSGVCTASHVVTPVGAA